MAWVKFVREDIEIEVEDGISVLEAEIQAGLRPDAPCGGLGKCGKCLVKINGEVVKACQIRIGEGETCVVETLDRAGNEKILTDGFNREVVFEPGLWMAQVELEKAKTGEKRSDWQRLLDTLAETDGEVEPWQMEVDLTEQLFSGQAFSVFYIKKCNRRKERKYLTMTVFFSQLINGLSLGSIYALIALGYSMVYGIILLLNFAHGDVIMVGAYMSWFVMNQLGLGPVTAVCATILTCTLLGVVIEKVAYTPLRNAPRISLLITAIGVSFFLEYTAELILGSGAKVIPAYYTNQTFRLGKVPLGLTSIITLVVTVLSMLGLTFLVQKTKLGKAMRAVSEDMDAARLMGINVNSTISFTFAVGSALAGIGSVLYCCSYPQATPTMGSMLGLKAFVAAVLGGIGSIPGAMIGGIAIGLCECFVSAIGLSAWKDAVTFAILIIVLLVKPTGFLGRKVQEKV